MPTKRGPRWQSRPSPPHGQPYDRRTKRTQRNTQRPPPPRAEPLTRERRPFFVRTLSRALFWIHMGFGHSPAHQIFGACSFRIALLVDFVVLDTRHLACGLFLPPSEGGFPEGGRESGAGCPFARLLPLPPSPPRPATSAPFPLVRSTPFPAHVLLTKNPVSLSAPSGSPPDLSTRALARVPLPPPRPPPSPHAPRAPQTKESTLNTTAVLFLKQTHLSL